MPATIGELFDRTAIAHPGATALRWREGGGWRSVTWAEYRKRVRQVARGLMALGVQPGQGVAILGGNRPEWLLAHLGAIAAGAVPTGIYVTSTADQIEYILDHCEAAVAVVEDAAQLDRVAALRERLPALHHLVAMQGPAAALTFEQLEKRASLVPEAALDERLRAQRPDDVCSLIYTSGTTGPPKAVMIGHRNVTFLAEAAAPLLQLTPEDRMLSYLPLSHIAEQMVSLYLPMIAGSCVSFAQSLEKLPDDLREVRPTLFFGVPRVWEKIQARIQAAGAQAPWLRRKLVAWARGQGLAGGRAEQRGAPKPAGYAVAERLVFRTVRRRLGLDAARLCLTSAAPIALDTLEFFLSLGIPILEVYGMSECTGPATMSLPGRYRTGRAGFAIPGTELRLATDGEVLMRGPHLFLGYFKDEAATRETRDAEGWLHSGDVGDLDGEGFLRITDRKKELLITSGGKNVAPAPIEARLKAIPGVAQVALVGDDRPYVAALLTLDPERLPQLAAEAGSPASDLREARDCPRLHAHLERHVERVNADLARYESVRRFALLPGELSVQGGELTPTLKLKRRVIREKYAAEIEALYRA